VTDDRPSPDALLQSAKREARGRLKILLGAAPGVGKTVEMLREGADLRAAGVDVVVGVVETHGRADTAALTETFEILPRKTIEHGAHRLDEFDLDAMLERRPQLALIDEFAHSNAPGSRHPKRWQDVEELRDAGIDVYTTLNIQHVESLNDVVASFTHVRVRETVPDRLLEDAEIEVVDLPPDELIARLKAGKVYVEGEAQRALTNFFTRNNLAALRELALRRAAQTVDRALVEQLHASGAAGTFAGGERIVVAVGDQPQGELLVRTAKRLADAFGGAWTAVSVETPRAATLDADARARIAEALRLAGSLGAQVITVAANDVIGGLRDLLAQQRATTLVIGKTPRSWWFEFRHGAVVDRLVRELSGVAVHVVPMVAADNRPARWQMRTPWLGLATGLAAVALTTLVALFVEPWIGITSLDLFYLVPVVLTATAYGLRPALAAALASSLAYNFFFLPPIHTFTIEDPQNAVTFAVLTGVGVVAAQLAGRVRRQANVGARSAAENAAVAAFGLELAAISDGPATARAVAQEVAQQLGVEAIMLTCDDGDIAVSAASGDVPPLSPIDLAAAQWAFERNETTGRDSSTLTASEWQFHPLATTLGVLAVLGVSSTHGGSPVPPDRQLLFTTLKGQAALAYERIRLEANAREVSALRQRDELRATLLSSIGHDLKTPLTSVIASVDALRREHPNSADVATLGEETSRLRRFFDDLIEMTRLEAGALSPRLEPLDLTDAVASAISDLREEIGTRRIDVDVPSDLPLVDADPRLLHHILINLIGNAAKFSPAATGLTLAAGRDDGGVSLAVLDRGVGLPPGDPAALFERFARVEGGDRTGGTGLGLAIVKGFAEVMGVRVTAANRTGGGATFTLQWPQAMVRA
jgi:two-component system sensor histidine kinase KdpD